MSNRGLLFKQYKNTVKTLQIVKKIEKTHMKTGKARTVEIQEKLS